MRVPGRRGSVRWRWSLFLLGGLSCSPSSVLISFLLLDAFDYDLEDMDVDALVNDEVRLDLLAAPFCLPFSAAFALLRVRCI